MSTYHRTFTIQSDTRPTFHDVTDQIQELVRNGGIDNGICFQPGNGSVFEDNHILTSPVLFC